MTTSPDGTGAHAPGPGLTETAAGAGTGVQHPVAPVADIGVGEAAVWDEARDDARAEGRASGPGPEGAAEERDREERGTDTAAVDGEDGVPSTGAGTAGGRATRRRERWVRLLFLVVLVLAWFWSMHDARLIRTQAGPAPLLAVQPTGGVQLAGRYRMTTAQGVALSWPAYLWGRLRGEEVAMVDGARERQARRADVAAMAESDAAARALATRILAERDMIAGQELEGQELEGQGRADRGDDGSGRTSTVRIAAQGRLGRDGGIGGPSAGLMLTLAYLDALGGGDLAGGRIVAGTGTVSGVGEVGPVAAVGLKTQGLARVMDQTTARRAVRYLVPRTQVVEATKAVEAITAAGSRRALKVAAVASVAEALAVLCADGGTAACPLVPAAERVQGLESPGVR